MTIYRGIRHLSLSDFLSYPHTQTPLRVRRAVLHMRADGGGITGQGQSRHDDESAVSSPVSSPCRKIDGHVLRIGRKPPPETPKKETPLDPKQLQHNNCCAQVWLGVCVCEQRWLKREYLYI